MCIAVILTADVVLLQGQEIVAFADTRLEGTETLGGRKGQTILGYWAMLPEERLDEKNVA